MTEPKRTELSVQMERALLVGVILPRSNVDPHDPLGELRSLVKTAGAKVVDEMIANRHDINGALYVGTGKAEEIAGLSPAHDWSDYPVGVARELILAGFPIQPANLLIAIPLVRLVRRVAPTPA